MLHKNSCAKAGAKSSPASLFQAGWKFRTSAILAFAAAFALCACAPAQKPQNSTGENSANYYLPSLPELAPGSEAWLGGPPFTEKELAAFVRDLHSIQTMNEQDTVNYLLRDRAWTRERLRYMDRKTALTIMAINSGNLESLAQEGPYFLPPTREEIVAIQKYYPVLNNMLKNNMLKSRESMED